MVGVRIEIKRESTDKSRRCRIRSPAGERVLKLDVKRELSRNTS